MARQARQKSELKVYHAILRGVNKQQIFECSEDYEHFVRILQRQCGLPVDTGPSKVAKHRRYQEVLDFSPSLADKVARNTASYTVEEIACEIAELINDN